MAHLLVEHLSLSNIGSESIFDRGLRCEACYLLYQSGGA
jgi:hypothetical protein